MLWGGKNLYVVYGDEHSLVGRNKHIVFVCEFKNIMQDG